MSTLNNTSTATTNISPGNSSLVSGTTNPYIYTTTGTINTTPAVVSINGPLTHQLGNDGISYQHEIAVLKVTRSESGLIIRSKMIKTFWVETLTQGSIEYAASKDSEVSKFEPEEIIIKTLRTIKL
jgi:hypothetical protein